MLQFIVKIQVSQLERRDPLCPQHIPQGFAIIDDTAVGRSSCGAWLNSRLIGRKVARTSRRKSVFMARSASKMGAPVCTGSAPGRPDVDSQANCSPPHGGCWGQRH